MTNPSVSLTSSPPEVSIVIPCFNEEKCIEQTLARVQACMQSLKISYEILIIDDGSTDQTSVILQSLVDANRQLSYLSLSRNFGHQAALKAGLDHAAGNCVVSLDADLQHPPELIGSMLEKWKEGFEVVYTRRSYQSDGLSFKGITSRLYYWVLQKLTDVKLEPGTADFRLLDRKVVDVLKEFSENFLFFRGLISWVGFRQIALDYEPASRVAGISKYSLRRMVRFALAGVTSFSVAPLRLAIGIGLIVGGLAFLYLLYVFYVYFVQGGAVSGWTSVIACLLITTSLQLTLMGVFGEYLGKLFLENKHRPVYIVRKTGGRAGAAMTGSGK